MTCDSSVDEEPKRIVIKEDMMKKHMPPSFPQALHGKKRTNNASEIFEVLKQVKVNIPLLDMIKQVPTYAKFLKDLCTVKKSEYLRDCGGESFVGLGSKCEFTTLLCLQAVGTWKVKPTSITLSLADRSVKIPRGMIEDLLVQVDKLYYPVDFVILDTDPIVK
ncbi:hypothetical protein CK203_003276 [Vitis vinifera]|uniref:Uncharacterized protein n=1 Tax=Vitis vinifera TaxID=29760 RepID=A0A438K7H2_VITVI|nr:hypothetical protein CK203_003276 [Vitis vinifera]